MRRSNYLPLCSIAGWDPTGGAGAAADLRVFSAHGGHGSAVITALTAQTKRAGITQLEPVSPELLRAQIAAIRTEAEPGAWKIGLLPSADAVRAVAESIADSDAPVILDPVAGATAGGWRAGDDTLHAIRDHLLGQTTLVTPNAEEAQRLTGKTGHEAVVALLRMGAAAVLVTGGDNEGGLVVDHLSRAGQAPVALEHPRVDGGPFHGTGCALSSAIAARLATGASLDDAITMAREYVHALLVLASQTNSWLLPHLTVRPT